jgi:hypothetical protein
MNTLSAKEVICCPSVSEACFLLMKDRPTLRGYSVMAVTCLNPCVMFVCSEIRSNLGLGGCFRRTVRHKLLVGNMKGEGRFVDLSLDGRISLTWTVKELDMRVWTGLMWLRAGTNVGPRTRDNEHCGTINLESCFNN